MVKHEPWQRKQLIRILSPLEFKKIGAAGIKNLESFARFLEIDKDAPKNVSIKKIMELADEITAAAWEKFKEKEASNGSRY